MLSGLSLPELACLLVAGVLLDLLLGEPRRWHPLVGFGKLAQHIEEWLNRGKLLIGRGVLAWMLAVLPLSVLAWLAADHAGIWLHAFLLYACIGLRSLRDHTAPIVDALRAGDLQTARTRTSWIVSRDTQHALEPDLAKAGAESLLENGNDAVFGTLFWFMVLGGAGAVLFRLANTLDAMWGYRNTRFNLFGRAAARIDDALNYLPARLTAMSYVLLAGRARGRAWQCWRRQAPAWSSPNAGPVMASGAGALGVSLGGAAVYDGQVEQRPPLGEGPAATVTDIVRAWRLVLHTTILWLGVAAFLAALIVVLQRGPHA
ncbi:adenosylcobinamide-phosphate synthase CbiB [Massilia consociata]|uniref:Cobalamin biosynthesis protein CobD n=1 Tax=Massilia consociata TaxID=760117 RepID=A0ABV6FM09_9BURK